MGTLESVYLRLLIGSDTPKPTFLYTATSEGAGKTLLAKLAIIPMLGLCPAGTVPTKEEEWRKLLFSLALADDAGNTPP